MNKGIIIVLIIIIAAVVIGAIALLMLQTPTTDDKTKLSVNGSKVTVINNNPDVWAHWDLEIQNAPQKNGTQQTYYVEVYIKPGENATFDLSSMLGYGEETLPQDTNLTVLAYGGLYNTTENGESKFNTTLVGWTVNQTVPSPEATYNEAVNPLEIDPEQSIGALPTDITSNTVTVSTTPGEQHPNDQLFAQFYILIGPEGVPYFELAGTPTLCEVIAGI